MHLRSWLSERVMSRRRACRQGSTGAFRAEPIGQGDAREGHGRQQLWRQDQWCIPVERRESPDVSVREGEQRPGELVGGRLGSNQVPRPTALFHVEQDNSGRQVDWRELCNALYYNTLHSRIALQYFHDKVLQVAGRDSRHAAGTSERLRPQHAELLARFGAQARHLLIWQVGGQVKSG